MQNLTALAGARGWAWRVERQDPPARGGCGLLHLSRTTEAGHAALVAVRPHEPVASIDADTRLRPVEVRDAAGALRHAAASQRIAFTLGTAARLRGDLHPWQLAAALAFARGHARVLVADEAGMGKTVTAGIAIAECLASGPERRCLVMAPGHLLRQWQAELRRRLSFDATLIDAAALQRLQQALPAGMSPWSMSGCLLVSPDFLKQPHLMPALERLLWDLLVIDEAHLVCGVSERHRAAEALAARSRQVLLLSATPSDGGEDRIRALDALGEAACDTPLIRLRHTAAGARRVERSLWIGPPKAVRTLHADISGYAEWISAAGDAPGAAHVLASVLITRCQSSAHAANLSLARRLALLGTETAPPQPSLFDTDDEDGLMGVASGRPQDEERRRLECLVQLAREASACDRRPRALLRLLRVARDAAVVFTCFRDTAILLHTLLAPHLRAQLIHGAMPRAIIETALEDFEHGRASVLVATDVAAHGLNLHHRCRWVIHYDLPWRPPAMRQRIGRVDRLGQTRAVHSTLLIDRTPLAKNMLTRLEVLACRMREDERHTARRWDVLAAREAARLLALRRFDEARPQPQLLREPATVVSVEIVAASGLVIERRLFALRATDAIACAWATEWAQKRRRQLERALAARGRRLARRETFVAGTVLASIPRALTQPGLFERRAARQVLRDEEQRLAVRASLASACARDAEEATIAGVRVEVWGAFTPCASGM